MRLVVTRTAEEQIRSASEWWYENRDSATGVFRSELARAFELVRSYPDAGGVATNVELQGVRRVLMRRCRYYLYYQVVEDVVEILALWHTSRGEEPSL